MIEITRYKDGITIKGHSGYAPIGQDIVCSAVSVLAQTLALSIRNLTKDTIKFQMKLGDAAFKFYTLSDRAECLIDAFFLGIEGIAEAYPENVKLINEAEPFTSPKNETIEFIKPRN